MKKILLSLMAVAMVAFSANATKIYVCGTKITGTTSFSAGGGTVSYNDNTRTLTITDVIYSKSGSNNNGISVDEVSGALTIKLIGTVEFRIGDADAVLCKSKKTTYIDVSGTALFLSSSSGHAGLKLQDGDVYLEGSGSLTIVNYVQDGCAIKGGAGTENLTFRIKDCVVGGINRTYGIKNLNSVTIDSRSSNYEFTNSRNWYQRSTQIRIYGGNTIVGATYPPVVDVNHWYNQGGVSLYLPYGTYFSEDQKCFVNNQGWDLSNTSLKFDDLRDNPDLTVDGNFLYKKDTMDDGVTCAVLVCPKVSFLRLQNKPAILDVPGYAPLNGTYLPVWINNYAFDNTDDNFYNLEQINFGYGTRYIASWAMPNLPNLRGISLPSTLKKVGSYIFHHSGNSDRYIFIHWSTLDPTSAEWSQQTMNNARFEKGILTLPTLDAIQKSQGTWVGYIFQVLDYPTGDYDFQVENKNYVVNDDANGKMSLVGGSVYNSTVFSITPSNTVYHATASEGGKTFTCNEIAPTAFKFNAGSFIIMDGITKFNCTATSIKEVGREAFYGADNLTWVSLPSSVTLIGDSCFQNCEELTNIEMPTGLTKIGTNLFKNCKSLNSITIPENVTYVSISAFRGCSGLKTINWNAKNGRFPDAEVSDFADLPFWGLNNVNTINIGNSVNYIQRWLFAQLPGLKTLTLGNSLYEIEEYAFYQCNNLTSVNLPNSLLSIGKYAFSQTGLTSMTIPNNLEEIDMGAFDGCPNLTMVNWNNTKITETSAPFYNCSALKNFYFCNGMTIIPHNICYKVTGLTSVSIPSTVTEIGVQAFAYCSALKSLSLPQSVKTIGQCAFLGSGLTSVTVPNLVTKLDVGTFAQCTSLKSVSLPQGLKTIDAGAFYLTGLTSITIPSSVNTIGQQAFSNCTSLANIYPKMTNPASLSYGEQIFEGVNKQTCKLTVPVGTLSKYKNTMPWKEFYNIVEGSGGVVGDVNGDGSVNAADITALYNFILNGDETYLSTSDVNNDNAVNAGDVTAVYNIILGN